MTVFGQATFDKKGNVTKIKVTKVIPTPHQIEDWQEILDKDYDMQKLGKDVDLSNVGKLVSKPKSKE